MPGSREVYTARVNDALAFINSHLAGVLTLAQLAKAANFSPFHFHRIFSALIGETPQQFTMRVRLEKAANMLVKNPNRSVTDIAFCCGFSSSATLARVFKSHFRMTASQYRRAESKPLLRRPTGAAHTCQLVGKLEVEVRAISEMNLAYVSCLNGYDIRAICEAWSKLYRWASTRNLFPAGTRRLGVTYDDPRITPAKKCRYYACITVPEGTRTQSPVGSMRMAGGKFVVSRVCCATEEIEQVYQYMYRDWLIDSGYQPADQPPFEVYISTPGENPDGKYLIDVCIPVIPL